MSKKSGETKRERDAEKNRLSARAARYARVGANVSGVAARYAGRRLLGGEPDRGGGGRVGHGAHATCARLGT